MRSVSTYPRFMELDRSHPAIRLAEQVVGDQSWTVTDVLERDNQAVLVEFRRPGERQTVILSAKDGEWVMPGVVSTKAQAVPNRSLATLRHTPFEHSGTRATGWPGPDGGPPATFWMTVDGFAAADAESVEVFTDLDRHEAVINEDGSFLTLVRAQHREIPRIRLRMVSGEHMDVTL